MIDKIVRIIESQVGECPKWDSSAADQNAEFDKWKKWSTRKGMRDQILGCLNQLTISDV